MARALLLCAVLAATLADAGSARAEPRGEPGTLAILSVPGQGLWGPDLERVDQAIRAGIADVKGTAVQPAATTAEHFAEARKMGLACDLRDVECAVKVGVLADASRVLLVAPSLERGVYAVSLLLVDVGNASVLGRLSWHASSKGDELERGMRLATSALLQPAQHAGALFVDVDRLGAQISVDDEVVGTSPLATAVTGLAPGPHDLVVRLEGAVTERRSVVIDPKAATTLSVLLRPAPLHDDVDLPSAGARPAAATADPPGRGPGALVVAGGVLTGLGVLATAGAGAGAGYIEAQLNEPMLNASRDAMRPWGQGLLIAVVGGVVVAAVGGGLLAVGLLEDAP